MFLDLQAEEVSADSLGVTKAQETAKFLMSGVNPYAILLRVLRDSQENEVLVVDLKIEVGQEPVYPICATERVALVFTRSDTSYPEVLSLRDDFPTVPHINVRDTEFPRSLCLYDQPYSQVRIGWTPSTFIERIRAWMRDTAKAVLHREDQPLEPILLVGSRHLIVPSDLFSRNDADAPDKLIVIPTSNVNHGEALVAKREKTANEEERKRSLAFVAMTLRCPAQTHGVIRHLPRNLKQLHDLIKVTGEDFFSKLKERLMEWSRDQAPLDARLLILGFFPKMRSADGPPEITDIWAFVSLSTIRDIGAALSLWETNVPQAPGKIGALIGVALDPKQAEGIDISVLNVSFALSRARAAILNGTVPDERRIVAVGVGALGSQIVPKLVRAGYGRWTLVDEDVLLPHNVARHELTHDAVGYPKAFASLIGSNQILEDPAVMQSIVVDVLRPGENQEPLRKAFSEADLIADFSASIPVARHLARDLDAPARRISAFMSPSGRDLVVLAESADRCHRLDILEMQYYRELLRQPDLASHLTKQATGQVRYARSCRDLTSTIPEDLVGLHSAIAARAIRAAADEAGPSIRLWAADHDLAVKSIRVDASPVVETICGEWRLCRDKQLLDRLSQLRKTRLPNETGGVLLGSVDLQRKIVYVVDSIPSPPDSKEWPTLYIRGAEGLDEEVQEAEERTAGMLHYVGEWHSHPDGCSTRPSGDDLKVFTWLTEFMQMDGLPALMAIVGKKTSAWYLGTMV